MKSIFKWKKQAVVALPLFMGIKIYRDTHQKSHTEFFYQKTENNQRILNLCKEHLIKYVPSYYLVPHGGLQQLWHIYGAQDRKLKINYEREILKMTDGGQICLDWAYPQQKNEECTKVCMVFPGLSGSSDRHYVKSLVHHLTEDRGYIVGVFHNRGVALEYTSPEFADLSRSEELEKAIEHMVGKFKNYPNVHYVGVGMSMGANLMMRVAGEQGEKFPLDAMVSFNNPFDVWLSINLMRNTPYEKFLAREMRKNIMIRPSASEEEKKIFQMMEKKFNFSFDDIQNAESWAEFDRKITLKIYPKYKTVADYYFAASCLMKVENIAKPTLVIHSKDDPIIPIDVLPVSECLANPNIIVGIVERGGHVCYFQGMNAQQRWYPLVSSEYLDAVIEIRNQDKNMLKVDSKVSS